VTRITGIDPGTTHSGVVVLSDAGHVLQAGVLPNEQVLQWLGEAAPDMDMQLAIEWISSYGMAVGREVFETCRWVGRFQQVWHAPEAVTLITRGEVKLQLCHSSRAKDPNVRQALIDLYQPTGGGSCPQIGTTKQRGPLYGVSSHAWSALAVAVVASGRAAKANREMVAAFMGETPLERIA
jgi:hypothetical protein